MAKNSGGAECALISWGIAALAAVVVFAMLMLLGGWTFLQAAFIGAIVFGAGGIFMAWAFCRPLSGPVALGSHDGRAAAPAAPPEPAAPAATPEAARTSAPAAAPVPERAAAPAPAPEPAPTPAFVSAPEPAPEPVPSVEQTPEPAAPAEETTVEDKPQLLDAPQGVADDLKQIKGVGPKLEAKLNEMGVWHFSQIASWTPKEVAWVDDTLNFRGRINRDDWIGQARILATGGTTEFAQRTGRK